MIPDPQLSRLPEEPTAEQPTAVDRHLETADHIGQLVTTPEILTENTATFSVHIDKAKLEELELPKHITSEAKKEELKRVVEIIGSLPEQLVFGKGITLIVGENGSGKSALAKALFFASEHAERKRFAGRDEETAVAHTESMLLNPTTGGGQDLKVFTSGLAAPLATAFIRGTDCQTSHPPQYVDVAEMFGTAVSNARKTASPTSMTEQVVGINDKGEMETGLRVITEEGEKTELFSTRQTVDRLLQFYKDRLAVPRGSFKRLGQSEENVVKGSVEFVDEPETGLSPRRHKKLEEEIMSNFGGERGENIVIVPTNSVVLFESDLPRIDLDFPERGIHRPSDYLDQDNI